jgi:predicted ester cyclase
VSPDDNLRLVRRFYEEVVNTGDVHRLAEFVPPVGIKGMTAHVPAVRTTYPGVHLAIERQIAEGEWVATCVTARGTHRGVWLGMGPTGTQVEPSPVRHTTGRYSLVGWVG